MCYIFNLCDKFQRTHTCTDVSAANAKLKPANNINTAPANSSIYTHRVPGLWKHHVSFGLRGLAFSSLKNREAVCSVDVFI